MRLVLEEVQEEKEQKQQQGQECLQDTSQKTLGQKLGYFWDYHKWKVIVPAVVLIVLFSVIHSYREETRDLTLYIAMMNAHMDSPEDVDFPQVYAADRQIDTQALPIRIDTSLYHPSPKENKTDEATVASVQKYRALLTSGKADVTITTSWVVDAYESDGCYKNLEEVLPSELYQSLTDSDKLYYATNETGKQIPVGIYMDQTNSLKEFYREERPIITISAFSKRTDASVDFITWLLAH